MLAIFLFHIPYPKNRQTAKARAEHLDCVCAYVRTRAYMEYVINAYRTVHSSCTHTETSRCAREECHPNRPAAPVPARPPSLPPPPPPPPSHTITATTSHHNHHHHTTITTDAAATITPTHTRTHTRRHTHSEHPGHHDARACACALLRILHTHTHTQTSAHTTACVCVCVAAMRRTPSAVCASVRVCGECLSAPVYEHAVYERCFGFPFRVVRM